MRDGFEAHLFNLEPNVCKLVKNGSEMSHFVAFLPTGNYSETFFL